MRNTGSFCTSTLRRMNAEARYYQNNQNIDIKFGVCKAAEVISDSNSPSLKIDTH